MFSILSEKKGREIISTKFQRETQVDIRRIKSFYSDSFAY